MAQDDGTVPGFSIGDKVKVQGNRAPLLTIEAIHQGEAKATDPHTGGSGWFTPDLLEQASVADMLRPHVRKAFGVSQ